MKKAIAGIVFSFCIFFSWAQDLDTYHALVSNIRSVKSPYITGNYLIFTQSSKFRHAGIAFDFENYDTVHTYTRVPTTRETPGEAVLFYILEIPENVSEIRYRVELDGLWTDDPTNETSVYDHALGLSLSTINVPIRYEYKTRILENGFVQFYFNASPGDDVRVAGTFNNWDPFMYELKEVYPGHFFLTLPIPKGEWFYAFFVGSTRYADPTNHNTVFSKDGKQASVLVLKN